MIATYRLQLHPDFTFADAEALLPYLQRLGVSHLYLSPLTEARPGSTHGYDVVDHNAVREELGGREGLDRLRLAAAERGMGIVLDWVPNHAGVGPKNTAWQDVLAYGRHSPFARYFDVDWRPLKPELRDRMLLPFLGQPYGQVLDAGEITVTYDDGRFLAAYYDNRYTLRPASYGRLLQAALPHYERTDLYFDLKDLTEAYADLDYPEREKAEALGRRLRALVQRLGEEDFVEAVREAVEEPEDLHELLEAQPWRLSYWKAAGHEINYRRFFDINGLMALRMEDGDVFWDAHHLLGDLLAQEGIDGVRIDHIDGLFDPQGYLERLRALGGKHVWVEKILAPGERLPEGWPTEGATGYEFMNDAAGALLRRSAEPELTRLFHHFVPGARDFHDEVRASKLLVIETMLSSELGRLAFELDRMSEADFHTRDFTLEALRTALAQVVAAFDRYRTYLPRDAEEARRVVMKAVARARSRSVTEDRSVFAFIAGAILGEVPEGLRERQRAWVARLQQYTAPVAAKGVEDTAFYRYVRLAALCEVGGEPDPFGIEDATFHEHAAYRAEHYPRWIVATATHDHKRGEDTRMRLLGLAERPERWGDVVQRLHDIGDAHRVGDAPAPSDAYLFFQLLVTLWHGHDDRETLADRLEQYAEKATREAKQRTSWTEPDEDYEEALLAFVRGVTLDDRTPEAVDELAALLARDGFFLSLSQTVLKLTTPGVPDVYQGAELLDLSLVDPDNRRPVDYGHRTALLDELEAEIGQADALRTRFEAQDDAAKLLVIASLLRLRREHPGLFGETTAYHALEPEGGDHVLAFARETEEEALVVMVSRYPRSFHESPPATLNLPDTLHGCTWTEALTGEQVDVDEMLSTDDVPLPWAVLAAKK